MRICLYAFLTVFVAAVLGLNVLFFMANPP